MNAEGKDTYRDEALQGLSPSAAVALDNWAATEGVRPDDPSWQVIGQIARSTEVATQAAQDQLERTVEEAVSKATSSIRDELREHTRRRVPRRPGPWLIVGGVQALLLAGAAYLGGVADLHLQQQRLTEISQKIESKEQDLAYLQTATHGLELLTYPKDEAVYIQLPRTPKHHCDGKPCLRIEENLNDKK